MRRLLMLIAAACLAAVPLTAVTKWKGLQPGVSTRADVDRVLGAPARNITDHLIVYNPLEGTGRIVVEYAQDSGSVNRIEIDLIDALPRATMVETFALAGIPSTKQPAPDGKLVEYFAGDASMVFFYGDKAEAAGVSRVGFYSLELFNRVSGASTTTEQAPAAGAPATSDGQSFPPTPGGFPPSDGTAPRASPSPAAVTPAAPEWNPKVEVFNPAACQDIYYWAQTEQDVARRGKNAARRQQILDILISAQRGDCAAARTKTERYKQAYR